MNHIKALTLIPLLLLSTGCVQRPQETVQPTPAPVVQPVQAQYIPVSTVYYPNQNQVPLQPTYPPQQQYPTQQYPTQQYPIVQDYPAPTVHTPAYTPRRSSYLGGAYARNYKLKKLINKMVKKYSYNRYELNAIFSTVKRDPEALKKIGAFGGSAKPTYSKATSVGAWDKYRSNFLTSSRIGKGVAFWKENLKWLNQASRRYGVAPEYILGIIGVETNYGGYTGKHSVLDSLTSIALEFPKRSKFFSSELENYLLIVRDQKIDPQSIKGSYAGAFGLSQFMPSSFREYGVDLDGDGKINLFTKADAIGSIARYFKEKGKWNNRIPVTIPTRYKKSRFYGLSTGFRTRYTQSHLRSLGMRPAGNLFGYRGKVSLIKLSRYNKDELWWGTGNFHTIARYNPKDHYAMAVHQLAQAIRHAYYGK